MFYFALLSTFLGSMNFNEITNEFNISFNTIFEMQPMFK